jgi:ACT domain
MAIDGREGEPGRQVGAMPARHPTLLAVEGRFAVCRLAGLGRWRATRVGHPDGRRGERGLPPGGGPAGGAARAGLAVPAGGRHPRLRHGGVLAGLTGPLAAAGVSVFAVSTFDTDYLLVKDDGFERVVQVLAEAGHDIIQ